MDAKDIINIVFGVFGILVIAFFMWVALAIDSDDRKRLDEFDKKYKH